MADPYDLQRFVDAQDDVYEQVCAELRDGRKASHWMWFVFPQLRELGRSATALKFGIASLEEACAYLRHPVLGPRLKECTSLATRIDGRSITAIFGSPDDLKFRSCMTLFQCAAPEEKIFGAALQKFFGGVPDTLTLELLTER